MIVILLLNLLCGMQADNMSSLPSLNNLVERGDLAAVRAILKTNPKNVTSLSAEIQGSLNSGLRTAAKQGNAEIVKLLIEHGADVKSKDSSGNTALHEAAGREVVKVLIAHGAKWDVVNDHRQTPMQYAADRRNPSVVLALRKAGANLDYESAVKSGMVNEVKEMLTKEPWLPKRPSKSLFDAVNSKSPALVKLLLQHGADPTLEAGYMNIPGPYTPLSEAVILSEYEIARQLCEAGARGNVSGGRNHSNLLLYCIAFKEPRYVELLLKHGANVSIREDGFFGVKGATPLHAAAALGGMQGTSGYMRVGEPDHANSKHEWAVEKATAMLNAQADPNARMAGGATPLHHALLAQNREVVTILLKEGSSVDLCAACALGRLDDVSAALKKEPKAVTQSSICNWPPLYWAILSGQSKMVELILASGGEPNTAADVLGYHPASGFYKHREHDERKLTLSPLSLAVQLGHLDIAQLLLKSDAAVDGDQDERNSPIELACWHGSQQMVEMLLKYHPNLNPKMKKRTSPLVAALKDRKLVQLLLDNGADPNTLIYDESLLIYVLKSAEYRPLAELLVAHGAKHNLKSACLMNQVDLVRTMLDKNASLASRQFKNGGECPLEVAIETGAEDVVLLLLDKKAIFKSRTYGDNGLLSLVARYGLKRVAEKLLKSGANIHALDELKCAPIHHAANQGQAAMVQFLIDNGANVNQHDGSGGDTPLHCCANKNYWRKNVTDEARLKTAETLLKAGAKMDGRNGVGQLPLHSAADHCQLGLVKLLVEKGADVNALDWHDQSPLNLTRRDRFVFQESERQDFRPIQEYLKQHGAK